MRDLDKAALFNETVFELTRAGREDLEFAFAMYLSDCGVNLALLNYRGERASGLKDSKNFVGAHHPAYGDLARSAHAVRLSATA